jgi:hypothetical protein
MIAGYLTFGRPTIRDSYYILGVMSQTVEVHLTMSGAVEAALRGRDKTDPRDKAAERLALHYAGLIDQAAPAARYRKWLATLSQAAAHTDDPDAEEAFEQIATALAEHSVASDLGPKLLAVLTSLGLTTAGRGAAKDAGGKSAAASPLDEIRARRAARGAG